MSSGRILFAAFVLFACGGEAEKVRPQWVLTLSTNAPVPELGDRLLVEILGDCRGECRRILRADRKSDWPMSVGVTSVSRPVQVRARLFRSELLGPEGEPTSRAVIDARGILPALSAHEERHVLLELDAHCFGVPSTDTTTCDADSGELVSVPTLGDGTPRLPGSWSEAQAIPCNGNPPPGMVCVAGGVFLFGDPDQALLSDEEAGVPERLVRVSPFFLDQREFSVDDYRTLAASVSLPKPPETGDASVKYSDYCTLSPTAEGELPLSCLTRDRARSICEARQLRLPTEAEWEFAAGNGPKDTRFSWGADGDACGHAVIGRAPAPFGDVIFPGFSFACRDHATPSLPPGLVAGGAPGDVSELGVHDLGGSVSEWVSDAFAARSAACWAESAIPLSNPSCNQGDGTGRGTLRGGNWAAAAADAVATRRFGHAPDAALSYVGVRCARSAD